MRESILRRRRHRPLSLHLAAVEANLEVHVVPTPNDTGDVTILLVKAIGLYNEVAGVRNLPSYLRDSLALAALAFLILFLRQVSSTFPRVPFSKSSRTPFMKVFAGSSSALNKSSISTGSSEAAQSLKDSCSSSCSS